MLATPPNSCKDGWRFVVTLDSGRSHSRRQALCWSRGSGGACLECARVLSDVNVAPYLSAKGTKQDACASFDLNKCEAK